MGRRRGRQGELPDLELLTFDEDAEADEDAPDDGDAGARRRGRLGAIAGAGLAAVLLVGLAVTDRPGPAVEVLPTPPTTVAPPPTSTPTVRRGPSNVMAAGGGDGVFLSGGRGERVVSLDPSLGAVTSVAAGRGFYVVTFGNGEARRYDRWSDAVGEALGPAQLVLEDPGARRVVWLVVASGGVQSIRAVADDDDTEAAAGSLPRFDVPQGWTVAGITLVGFVLQRAGSEGIATWAPWEGSGPGVEPVVLDERGRFVASDRSSVAWNRDGILVEAEHARGTTSRLEVATGGAVVAGRYAPDGRHLALLSPAGDARWTVQLVSRGRGLRHGLVVVSATAPKLGWSAEGELLVDPGSAAEHRYDPRTGLVTRRPAGTDGA